MKPLLILLCLAVAAFRPVLLFVEVGPHVQGSYEAVAHLLVGGLAGAWLMHRHAARVWRHVPYLEEQILYAQNRYWLRLSFWLLAAVELVCVAIKLSGVLA